MVDDSARSRPPMGGQGTDARPGRQDSDGQRSGCREPRPGAIVARGRDEESARREPADKDQTPSPGQKRSSSLRIPGSLDAAIASSNGSTGDPVDA